VNVYERRGEAEDIGLNVRLLNDVEMGRLKITKGDAKSAEPRYKCP
jgi:hypothetical protein